jgi:hypothetical protein
MILRYLIIVLFFWLNNYSIAQQFSSKKSPLIFILLLFLIAIESPRLCVYHNNPSQYYPCALNYIGVNSWSLYQCPENFIFDETSQQCLMKVPISDTFDQLASLSSIDNTLFQKIASFIVPQEQQRTALIKKRLNDVGI